MSAPPGLAEPVPRQPASAPAGLASGFGSQDRLPGRRARAHASSRETPQAEWYQTPVNARRIDRALSGSGDTTLGVAASFDDHDVVNATIAADPCTVESLLAEADERLYEAKAAGRDRVVSGDSGRSAVLDVEAAAKG